jgi:hypothetical protein
VLTMKVTKKQSVGDAVNASVVVRLSGRAADLVLSWSAEAGESASTSWLVHRAIEAANENQRFQQLLEALNAGGGK